MVSSVEAVGLLAGLLISAGFVPQIIRVWKLKDATEISLMFNVLNLSGTVLWLAYGVLQNLLSVMVWNAVNTALVGGLLAVKLRYGMGPSPVRARPSSER